MTAVTTDASDPLAYLDERPVPGSPRDYRFPSFTRTSLDNGLTLLVKQAATTPAHRYTTAWPPFRARHRKKNANGSRQSICACAIPSRLKSGSRSSISAARRCATT